MGNRKLSQPNSPSQINFGNKSAKNKTCHNEGLGNKIMEPI